MQTATNIDDLKSAWQALDKKLDLQNRLMLEQKRETKMSLLRKPLRSLRWGQIVQILFGIAMIIFSVSVWTRHPVGSSLFLAGIVMHAYGIAMGVLGGLVHGRVSSIDLAAPIVSIQKQIAQLRKTYVTCSMTLGLLWWVLWIPFMMMVFDALFGADMYANMPTAINWMLAVGIAGFVLTVFVHRWAVRHPRFGKSVEASTAGASLNRAQTALDDILAFENESF